MEKHKSKILFLAGLFLFLVTYIAISRFQLGLNFAVASENTDQENPASYERGEINGVRLSIPDNYLISPIDFREPVKPSDAGSSKVKSEYLEINDFSILMRLSNFQPRISKQDEKDWLTASTRARPTFMASWLMVDFDNRHPVDLSLPNEMPDRLHQDPANWGPYVRNQDLYHGLTHYESVKSVDDDPVGHVEYYYREGSHTTIVCNTERIKVAPFDTHDVCKHYFEIPELHLMAEAFYTKSDLHRWNQIEAEVLKTVHQFVDK